MWQVGPPLFAWGGRSTRAHHPAKADSEESPWAAGPALWNCVSHQKLRAAHHSSAPIRGRCRCVCAGGRHVVNRPSQPHAGVREVCPVRRTTRSSLIMGTAQVSLKGITVKEMPPSPLHHIGLLTSAWTPEVRGPAR